MMTKDRSKWNHSMAVRAVTGREEEGFPGMLDIMCLSSTIVVEAWSK